MDTQFTAEELAFQAEVRQGFAEVMDEELRALLAGGEAAKTLKEGMIEYQRRLNAKGWMAPGWRRVFAADMALASTSSFTCDLSGGALHIHRQAQSSPGMLLTGTG